MEEPLKGTVRNQVPRAMEIKGWKVRGWKKTRHQHSMLQEQQVKIRIPKRSLAWLLGGYIWSCSGQLDSDARLLSFINLSIYSLFPFSSNDIY